MCALNFGGTLVKNMILVEQIEIFDYERNFIRCNKFILPSNLDWKAKFLHFVMIEI